MKMAVLVIDMIKDFVTGKFENERAQKIIPNIERIVEVAESGGIPVIYVCDSHSEDDREFSIWGSHAIAGTEGAEIVPELEPREGQRVLEKTKYSAFFDTKLDEVLDGLGVDTIVLAGVLTEICIQHTAADAFYRGYDIIVPKEGVESTSEKRNKDALDFLEGIYGARILDLEEVVEELGGRP